MCQPEYNNLLFILVDFAEDQIQITDFFHNRKKNRLLIKAFRIKKLGVGKTNRYIYDEKGVNTNDNPTLSLC